MPVKEVLAGAIGGAVITVGLGALFQSLRVSGKHRKIRAALQFELEHNSIASREFKERIFNAALPEDDFDLAFNSDKHIAVKEAEAPFYLAKDLEIPQWRVQVWENDMVDAVSAYKKGWYERIYIFFENLSKITEIYSQLRELSEDDPGDRKTAQLLWDQLKKTFSDLEGYMPVSKNVWADQYDYLNKTKTFRLPVIYIIILWVFAGLGIYLSLKNLIPSNIYWRFFYGLFLYTIILGEIGPGLLHRLITTNIWYYSDFKWYRFAPNGLPGWITGLIERSIFFIIIIAVGKSAISGVAPLIIAWIVVKMASNWQRNVTDQRLFNLCNGGIETKNIQPKLVSVFSIRSLLIDLVSLVFPLIGGFIVIYG